MAREQCVCVVIQGLPEQRLHVRHLDDAAEARHRDAVAPVMKVLKVQRMIIYLFDRGAIESCRANLEFQDEDSPTDYEDDVCSLPYIWDGKLKKDVTCSQVGICLSHASFVGARPQTRALPLRSSCVASIVRHPTDA